MELIFIFAVVFFEIFLIYFLQIMQVIRAFVINTFLYNKVLAVFLGDQCIATVRTPKLKRGKPAVLWRESGRADSTEKLPFGAIVLIKKGLRGITSGAGTMVRDVTFRPAADRADLLTVTFFKVRDEVFVIPVLAEVGDQRELINLELLILWRMGIIKSPLPERDISANKVN